MANKDLKMKIWREGDEETPEIEYLKENYGFTIDPCDYCRHFMIDVKGIEKFYPVGTEIHFHNIVYSNETGKVITLLFKFQKAKNVIWKSKDGKTEEICYLIENYNFSINKDEMKFVVEGKNYSYPADSEIEFYDIVKDSQGKVLQLRFQISLKGSKTWKEGKGLIPEIRYLKEKYKLFIIPCNGKAVYNVYVNKELRRYTNVEKITFGNIVLNENGTIKSLSFNFVCM